MQGARCDAVRALLAAGNAAERRLWKSEITIIYWGLLSAKTISPSMQSYPKSKCLLLARARTGSAPTVGGQVSVFSPAET